VLSIGNRSSRCSPADRWSSRAARRSRGLRRETDVTGAGENILGDETVPVASIPSQVDIDGDGFMDIVDPGKGAWVLNFQKPWCVWLGHAGSTFEEKPRLWSVPHVMAAVGLCSRSREPALRKVNAG
jgi:hypothetical protein